MHYRMRSTRRSAMARSFTLRSATTGWGPRRRRRRWDDSPAWCAARFRCAWALSAARSPGVLRCTIWCSRSARRDGIVTGSTRARRCAPGSSRVPSCSSVSRTCRRRLLLWSMSSGCCGPWWRLASAVGRRDSWRPAAAGARKPRPRPPGPRSWAWRHPYRESRARDRAVLVLRLRSTAHGGTLVGRLCARCPHTYSQLHSSPSCSPECMRGANVSPAVAWSPVPLCWVHFTSPLLGTVSPRL